MVDRLSFETIDGKFYELPFDSCTAFGEPQAWVYLKDGTSLEITHEEEGLPDDKQYYSIRLHCSEEDFENDLYHKTMGVIDSYVGDAIDVIKALMGFVSARGHVEGLICEGGTV